MAARFASPWTLRETDTVTGSSTLSENGRVLCWRLAQLSDAGYTDEAAAILATRADLDLHCAIDLLFNGCPHETALRILL
jgi:hypothetical protein